MTDKEKTLIELLRQVSNEFVELEEYDQDHNNRRLFIEKIRELQAMVMCREAFRNNPDVFKMNEFGGLTDDFDD